MENEKLELNEEQKESVGEETKKIALLPIGSVVLLKNGTKRIMVYGRKMRSKSENRVFDYIGCLYPEGAMDSEHVILFDHEQIQLVYFIGFQDVEEFLFRSRLNKEI